MKLTEVSSLGRAGSRHTVAVLAVRARGVARALLTVCVAGLAACGGKVSVAGAGADALGGGGAGGQTGGGGGGAESAGGGGALPIPFCSEACAVTSEDGCFATSDCMTTCEAGSPDWTAEVREAFVGCAAENPLCFESIEGCLLTTLHPPGAPRTVRLQGSGLDAFEGVVVRVWHDPGTGAPFGAEAPITDGAFSFEWTEPLSLFDTGGPLLLAYLDLDADGACDAELDLTASVSTAWNGDLLDPVYEALLTPPLADPGFVCDFVP
jgi:hypothetical protein